jgi:hypothetical protein
MVLITSLQFVFKRASKSAFLNVLLAVNKSKPDDGEQVLQDLKLGFERIFALLSGVAAW